MVSVHSRNTLTKTLLHAFVFGHLAYFSAVWAFPGGHFLLLSHTLWLLFQFILLYFIVSHWLEICLSLDHGLSHPSWVPCDYLGLFPPSKTFTIFKSNISATTFLNSWEDSPWALSYLLLNIPLDQLVTTHLLHEELYQGESSGSRIPWVWAHGWRWEPQFKEHL